MRKNNRDHYKINQENSVFSNTDCMSVKWQAQPMDALYDSWVDEEMCRGVKLLCYCRVDGVESLLTVIGNSICLEKVLEENSWMTSSERRVTIAGSQSSSGYIDGPGLQARFQVITDICVDVDNRVIICDLFNGCVRMMDLTFPHSVVTLCGRPGSLNAELSSVRFNFVSNVCVDALNNIYLCENLGNKIMKIDGKRETIVTFFDNSMLCIFYQGRQDLKEYSVLKYPTTIMIQDNRNLIISNHGNRSLCKVSLYDKTYSVVKYGLNFNSNFAIDKSGDIIVCENKTQGRQAFHKILSNGQEIHIADKVGPQIRAVIQFSIRQHEISGRLCFFTTEHDLDAGMNKIVKTRMKLKWGMLRVLFLACLKPDVNVNKTFARLPAIGDSGKYNPILKMIIDFVNI